MSSAPDPGEAHAEAVRIYPIPGTDDLRVRGLSIDHLVSDLHGDHPVTVHPLARHPQTALSEREVRVLRLIASGLSNDDVARVTGLNINTVKAHIRAAYRKVGVHSRSQAVLWSVAHGMVEAPDDAEG